jgi:hypothetical protein
MGAGVALNAAAVSPSRPWALRGEDLSVMSTVAVKPARAWALRGEDLS